MSEPIDPAVAARVVRELTEVVAAVARDTTEMWATGELVGTSTRARVAPEFAGTQHAPWFTEGAFVAGRDAWVDGTAEAARAYHGKGIRWETCDAVVLPRGEHEAAVSYRVVHHWGDERPPAQALFLETWVKRDGEWVLLRHTAEKA